MTCPYPAGCSTTVTTVVTQQHPHGFADTGAHGLGFFLGVIAVVLLIAIALHYAALYLERRTDV